MEKEQREFLELQGWAPLFGQTSFYGFSDQPFELLDSATQEREGEVWTRNGKIAAHFVDFANETHEYVFGNGAAEFTADCNRWREQHADD